MNEIYSPGLEGVIAGETAISTVDGGLIYRGYSVEDLAAHASFEETAYILLHGALPNQKELAAFNARLAASASIAPALSEFLGKIPQGVPMMDCMRTGASALAHWDPDKGDNSHDANVRKAERLLVQLPIVMATRFRLAKGQKPVAYNPKLSLAGNVLWMLFDKEPTERLTTAMNVSLILYAEHEYNASTFTARVVASTLSDVYSAISAAIGALKGPLHGGANEAVMDVLREVGTADKAEGWIRKALAEKRRIMGFGHRVYKTGDPRAIYLRTLCKELAEETKNQDMEAMADTIERFVTGEKGLPPNLDWPSARLYYYMGLDIDLYTPLFVVSRVTGWSAHVIEQLDNNRLIRPRARYTGPQQLKWAPIASRG